MSSTLARPMLRQSGAWSRMAARRFESTAASKATESAKESAAKAKESFSKAASGLSKVTSQAGPAVAAMSGAAKNAAGSLSKIGGPVGTVVAFIEKQTPTVVFYSKVGAELAKIVFRGQKMSPPSVSTMQSYYQGALKALQNPSTLLATASATASKTTQQSASFLQRLQNMNMATLAAGGVVAAECLGFFTVGEMIGRFKIVGYHGAVHSEHH